MSEWIAIILFSASFFFLAWYRLSWAIGLTLFLLPAYQLRFSIGLLPMTFLEIMLIGVIGVWVVRSLLNQTLQKAWFPWKWLTIAFILAGALAVVVSPDLRGGLGLWKAYMLEPILFFYVFVNEMSTPARRRQVLFCLGMSVVLIGFVALLQSAGLVPGVEPYISETPSRATSLFAFPTAIGKYVSPILALFLGMLLVGGSSEQRAVSREPERRVWHIANGKWFIAGVVVFGLIGLMLSVSRGALIGVAGAVVFISFFSRWKKWLWVLCVLVALAVVLVPSLRNEAASVVSGSDVSTDVRLVMWKGTLRLIQDRPVFGAGLAGFPIVYADYKEASHTEFFPNPDHLLLTLWAEMGFAGLVVFIWVLVKYVQEGVAALKTDTTETKALTIGLIAALVAFIVYGFLDTPYFKNDLAVIFWTLTGLVVLVNKSNISRSSVLKE
ncbi:MAG: O-antigen ligase family protein [Parcubacteria group bacterium]